MVINATSTSNSMRIKTTKVVNKEETYFLGSSSSNISNNSISSSLVGIVQKTRMSHTRRHSLSTMSLTFQSQATPSKMMKMKMKISLIMTTSSKRSCQFKLMRFIKLTL